MRHFRVLLILLVGIVSIAWTNNASAVWYAGNKRLSAYDVYARIFNVWCERNMVTNRSDRQRPNSDVPIVD